MAANDVAELRQGQSWSNYLVPKDLARTELPLRRVLLVGSCFAQSLGLSRFAGNCEVEFWLSNQLTELPDAPQHPLAEYDFQLVQIPLRFVMPEALLWRLAQGDAEGHEQAFAQACDRLQRQFDLLMKWNRQAGLQSYVLNFFVPQQNGIGRFAPRYDLSNPVYFVEQLNRRLYELTRASANAELLDADAMMASVGRRFVQEDCLGTFSHGSVAPHYREVTDRMEPVPPMTDHYVLHSEPLGRLVWDEAVAMHRTLRQIDQVKLVVVDLDDTVWKGVSGDQATIDGEMVEGWPIGIMEALAYLKKRGILLAILSKNDDERIQAVWRKLYPQFPLSEFAARKINWKPKTENMAELLRQVNLLPRNVVYIDDNPVERAAMQQAYPDMRIIGRYPYLVRRILLWSPEMQVATITAESAARTEMVQAQIERVQESQGASSREAFLLEAQIRMEFRFVAGRSDPRMPRCFELLNKTNQFNTTGKRWTQDELDAEMAKGLRMAAFEVQDRFTGYGLVGVMLFDQSRIRQFVMSCRVVGMDIERAALAVLCEAMRRGGSAVIDADLVPTDANLLCRDIYRQAGFDAVAGGWRLAAGVTPAAPAWVSVTQEGELPGNPTFTLEPTSAQAVSGHFGIGWSTPEQGGTWMVDSMSELKVPGIAPPGAAQRVELALSALSIPGMVDSQELIVELEGETLYSGRLRHMVSIAFDIPAALVRPEMNLKLHHGECKSPRELGHNSDPRCLSFLLRGATCRLASDAEAEGQRVAVPALG